MEMDLRASQDDRLVAISRLILAGSGLLIVFLIPDEPNRFVLATYASLVAYTVYGAALLLLLNSDGRWSRFFFERGHWIDVGCYTVLITLSSGTNSTFFFGYLFCIIVASFRWGFASGIRVAVASTLLFTFFGYLSSPPPPEFEAQRFLIRPIYLMVLGYMLASWGEHEIELRRRLRFLKDVSTVSNPRFGIDQTLGVLMHRLMNLYRADAGILITVDEASARATLRRARRTQAEGPVPAEEVPDVLAGHLLDFPGMMAASFGSTGGARTWTLHHGRLVRDYSPPSSPALSPDTREFLAATLEAEAILTVPLHYQNRTSGRLFLARREPRPFEEDDAGFLLQVVEHTMPIIDHIRLVDQLASDAAREERRKLARDIHDSVIQPYVGLQIGLSALANRSKGADADLDADIRRLLEFTSAGLADLRRQVTSLREGGPEGGSLAPAVSRFAARFYEATGIKVDLDAQAEIPVSDRLAGEIFQMIAEGLSNVRRHTRSSLATVRLACNLGMLHLRIENEAAEGDRAATTFTPRSISERSAALGGRAWVERRGDGGTVVAVDIPL